VIVVSMLEAQGQILGPGIQLFISPDRLHLSQV
jgi:hypothetical protein